ncbi:MAG: hypothetical protein ACFCU2_03610 [Acidimicrobiia bacterium]
MTTTFTKLTRPTTPADPEFPTRHRRVGFTLAVVGLMLAMISLIANLVAAGQVSDGESGTVEETLAWSFGLNTAAFGTIKLAIATVLIGILVRLWQRAESVKRSLPELKAAADPKVSAGPIATPF